MRRFIVFEGLDGCGKETQALLLRDYLRSHGHACVLTREPGGTPIADALSDIVVKGGYNGWDSMSEALVMCAARRNHVVNVIKPALDAGQWVICSRFTKSTYVYQAECGTAPYADVAALVQMSTLGITPHLEIVLDLPPEVALQRAFAKHKNNRFERMDIQFHTEARYAYTRKAHGPSSVIIRCTDKSPLEVNAEVLAHFASRFGMPAGFTDWEEP